MPKFKVIRASAGSGKTFNLTREYLRLLFGDTDEFMHILAVTFTNKATEEMKSRIISELYAISNRQPSKQLDDLVAFTGLSESQIRNRATVILKKLLHRYSGFSVCTIDTFFQRIIRGFTRELGIQGGYSIELDTGTLISEITNRLFVKAGEDNTLLNWLTLFAESLIEKGENWNFRKGITNLGNEIFKEAFNALDDNTLKLFANRSFLNDYRNELYVFQRNTDAAYRNFGSQAKEILAVHNLEVDDFSGKSRGPAGFLTRLESGAFREPTATAIQAAETLEKWYTANAPRKDDVIDVAQSSLMPLMQQVIDYHDKNHQAYYTATVILKNLYTLGILTDLSQLAEAWCVENNAFLLTEAPVFLNKLINGNDTPFIYEKAGCWYHHFMIDEFQDTSLLQWKNFKPLISNSLSQDFDNLAVGDAKQSIYRWRNSNWEILEKGINQDFMPEVIHEVELKENWRSLPQLVHFNNRFFTTAPAILQQEFNKQANDSGFQTGSGNQDTITGLYRNAEQIAADGSKTGGFVQVDFIDKETNREFEDFVNNRLVALIGELQDKGYRLSDMAILTRKNSEAKAIADFILNYVNSGVDNRHRFDIISDEALQLGSSIVVNFVVALLQYLADPYDDINNYLLSSVYHNYTRDPSGTEPWKDPGIKGKNHDEVANQFPEGYKALVQSQEAYSLIEIVTQIAVIFKLERFPGEQVYLQAFKDLIMEYSRKSGGSIPGFIEYWDETGKDKTVSAPASQDAIRILTLHKSKGLEFEITIIPYCTWDLVNYSRNIIWCASRVEPFSKVPVIPLTFTTQLKNTVFAGDFLDEYYRQLIDNLNLLYVAFTRAKTALYVMCKAGKEDQMKNVSDLIRQVIGQEHFVKGTLPEASGSSAQQVNILEPVSSEGDSLTNRIQIAFQGKLLFDPTVNKPTRPINEGKILHEIFTLLRTPEDIEPAVSRFVMQGKIAKDEQDQYVSEIRHAMNDIQAATWFTNEWKILNEPEIILPGGGTKRPDRVMTRGDQTLIIDYKFGSRIEDAHELQIKEYARLLHTMGYENIEACLWYVRLGKVLSFKV